MLWGLKSIGLEGEAIASFAGGRELKKTADFKASASASASAYAPASSPAFVSASLLVPLAEMVHWYFLLLSLEGVGGWVGGGAGCSGVGH